MIRAVWFQLNDMCMGVVPVRHGRDLGIGIAVEHEHFVLVLAPAC